MHEDLSMERLPIRCFSYITRRNHFCHSLDTRFLSDLYAILIQTVTKISKKFLQNQQKFVTPTPQITLCNNTHEAMTTSTQKAQIDSFIPFEQNKPKYNFIQGSQGGMQRRWGHLQHLFSISFCTLLAHRLKFPGKENIRFASIMNLK